MKKILVLTGLVFSVLTIAKAQNSKVHTWRYTITPNTTHKAIDSLIADWKTHNIDLQIKNAKYDDKGRLVSFEGNVVNHNGKQSCSGRFGNAESKVITITLTDQPSVRLEDGK